ncbi:MAG: cache domain-containing protein [Alphaproteobacteria bacterium]
MSLRSPNLRSALLALLAAALLPIVGAMTYATWHAWRENRDRNVNEIREEATDAAKRLSTSIDEARRVLHRLSHDPAIIAGDVATCERLTADYQQLHPSFRNIGLVGPDGRLLCSARSLGGNANFSDYPIFREAASARSLLLRELPRELSGKSILACVYPVRDSSNEFRGAVFVSLAFRSLADLTIGDRLPPGSTVTLFDNRGTVVLREPDRAEWNGRLADASPTWKLLRSGRLTKATAPDLDGTDLIFGAERIPATRGQPDGWLAVGVPPDVVTEEPRRNLGWMLLGLGATLAALAGGIWWGIDHYVLHPVRSIEQAARGLASGQVGVRSSTSQGAHELTRLGVAFDEMADSLERSLGDTNHALDVVRRSQDRLRILSQALLEGQEAERSQLARGLHDEVGQALTAATLNLDALRGPESPAGGKVDEALEVVKRALNQVRDLSLDLHPSILDDLGLAAALRWYLGRQSERSGLLTSVDANGLDRRLPKPVETACFRICQEAVTNVLKHADAARVDVKIGVEGGTVRMSVIDDGRGFDVEEAHERTRRQPSLGLIGMEERATLLGGSLDVVSTPGAGTEIRLVLPLQEATTEALTT